MTMSRLEVLAHDPLPLRAGRETTMRRGLQLGSVRILAAGAALGAVSLWAIPGFATTYVIAQGNNNMTTSAPGCGFMEAIASVNAGKGMFGCSAPTGGDVIEL